MCFDQTSSNVDSDCGGTGTHYINDITYAWRYEKAIELERDVDEIDELP
jgi:hypothetical protein